MGICLLYLIIYVCPSYFGGVNIKSKTQLKTGDVILLDYWGLKEGTESYFEVLFISEGKVFSEQRETFAPLCLITSPRGSETDLPQYFVVKKVPIIWHIKYFLSPVAGFVMGSVLGLILSTLCFGSEIFEST